MKQNFSKRGICANMFKIVKEKEDEKKSGNLTEKEIGSKNDYIEDFCNLIICCTSISRNIFQNQNLSDNRTTSRYVRIRKRFCRRRHYNREKEIEAKEKADSERRCHRVKFIRRRNIQSKILQHNRKN